MISAGRLRFVGQRYTPSTTQDALGMRTDVWTARQTFRCDLRNDSAQEQQYADGVAVIRSCEVRMRWNTAQSISLSELDRIAVRGKTLRIRSIINLDEQDAVAVIECEAVE